MTESKKITIILADDHPIVTKALKDEFNTDDNFEVIAEATNGEEAVKLVNELTPNVVIMDIGMPKVNGIEATRQIKAMHPDIIILILSVYDDDEHVLEILEAGADGYLTKTVAIQEIIQATRSVIAGEAVLAPNIFKQVLKYALRHSVKPLPLNGRIKLTVRELEILRLVAAGLSNKIIAEKLGLGDRTIKSHMVDIFSKLAVSSRTEAVITGIRSGFLKVDDLG